MIYFDFPRILEGLRKTHKDSIGFFRILVKYFLLPHRWAVAAGPGWLAELASQLAC